VCLAWFGGGGRSGGEGNWVSRQPIARRRTSRHTFDQFDDFGPLARRKFEESLQQSQAFDRFVRWSSELLPQLCDISGIFHLAPWVRNRMAYPGKREGLAQKVDAAAQEAERLGLATATTILRMARLESTGRN